MRNDVEELEEGPKAKLNLYLHRATLKKYLIKKHLVMDTGFKIPFDQ